MSQAMSTGSDPTIVHMYIRLCVQHVAEAILFYQQAFGASEVYRLVEPGGGIIHAELALGTHKIELVEEDLASRHNLSPQTLGGSSVVIKLYVEDADAFFNRAIASGAQSQFPLDNHFFGDRSGRFVDPFGHLWSIATRLEDVAPEEMQRRLNAMLDQ